MVNYEEAIRKPFTDLGKLVLGIILSIIPIVNWIAQGYILENSGVGKNKPSKKLIEWKNFPDFFIKGFLSYVIMFIYMIPAIIVLMASIGYAVSSLFTVFSGILPEGFMSAMMAGQVVDEQVKQLISQNWMLALPTLITVAPFVLLGLILALLALYFSPIATLNYLKNRKFGKAFDFNFIISKALKAEYFISWIIVGVIGIILKSVLTFIPWIGLAIAYFISGVIAYSLFGQVFREK
jgi:hypothetical protein